MQIEQVPVTRLRFASSRPFDEVLEALEKGIGHPDMPELNRKLGQAESLPEFAELIEGAVGSTGLMEFLSINLGSALRRDPAIQAYKMVRIIVGNPLIMTEMTRYVPDAGSYAPVTLLVYEQHGKVHICYDTMASLIAPYRCMEALEIAYKLDAKVIAMLERAR